jgi:hypothetical protein
LADPKYLDAVYLIRNNMTAQHIETKQNGTSTTTKKVSVIGLAVLPIVLAAYSNNGISVNAIPSILTSGVFPIGFTLLSWGLAAKIGLGLRK